jgi:hypothetical protein
MDPRTSGLIFQKDSNSGSLVHDVLTVCICGESRISQHARQQAAGLVIHVVSTFSVAAFQHVIGYLWPSFGHICVDTAKSFYSRLFRSRGGMRSNWEVALALQESIGV